MVVAALQLCEGAVRINFLIQFFTCLSDLKSGRCRIVAMENT